MKLPSSLLGFVALATLVNGQFQADGAKFKSPVTTATGFKASVVFSNATAPRGITFDSEGNLLVVERGLGVTAYTRVTTPTPGWQRTVVVKNANLTHGIEVNQSLLVVSTATTVLAYQYNATSKTVATASYFPYVYADGLPGDGELTTHTLLFERNANGYTSGLLVGSGPLTNIDVTARDPASGRSQIRRLVYPNVLPPIFPPPSIHYEKSQIVAYGIRNPGGFAFYNSPIIGPAATLSLAVVENGASIDNVTGLTPAFVNDNPADEINLVTYPLNATDAKPLSYGFPDCTTLWNPKADPVGVPQYVNLPRGAQISLNLDKTHDDKWCSQSTNNQPPAVSFQASSAHSVPLDIKFFNGPTINATTSLPTSIKGQAFVSFHGSFDRSPPTGYGVVRLPANIPSPINNALGYAFVVQATELKTCPGTCIRPVGLAFSKDGKLFVSSDSSGEIFVLESNGIIPVEV